MHGHLVTIEVSVKGRANERVYFNGVSLNQDGFERLDTQPVQRRSTVEHHRTGLDHFLQYFPHLRFFSFNEAPSSLHVDSVVVFDELLHDKGTKQLQRHAFRQSALMQLELRANDDNRAARVVHPFAKEVPSKPTLFTLQHVRKGLQLTAPSERNRLASPAVVNE